MSDFLDDDFEACSVSSNDSSSDSSEGEFEDNAAYLASISLRPANFRAEFMGPEGLNKLSSRKLVKVLREVVPDLYDFHNNEVSFKGPVVKPLDGAKNYLAHHYFSKYGIHILPATGATEEAEKANILFKELQIHGETPFGVILSPLISGDPSKGNNFKGHVLPYLVQRTGHEVHILELNSASPDHGVLASLADHLLNLLANNPDTADCEVCLHQLATVAVPNKPSGRAGRQVDLYSCHTDAIQLLKDALVLHRNSHASEPIWQIFPEYPDSAAGAPSCPRRIIGLPAPLLKTAQYPVFLDAMGGGQETLSHRRKYSANLDGTKTENYFLLVKALRNSVRVAQQYLAERR